MNFFQYYTKIKELPQPFLSFSWGHLGYFLIAVLVIGTFFRFNRSASKQEIRRIEKGLVVYFLIEEFCYTIWVLLKGPSNPLTEVLPLHLCSICIYTSVFAIVFNHEKLRRFVALNSLLGGVLAICYPSNISGIYPLFSYRVINFYMLHIALVIVACLQIKQLGFIRLKDLKFNMSLLAVLTAIAMLVNINLHTDYLLVGTPPTVGIINLVYQVVGITFYYPAALLVLFGFQLIMMNVVRTVSPLFHKKTSF